MPENTETAVEPEVDETRTSDDDVRVTDIEADDTTVETETEPETFPRDYVERLRKESAGYRDKARDRDDLAHRLHAALTAADGRLAAPDELDFDEAHLTDPGALTAAIDDLLARKPYLAARRPAGDVGQGQAGTTSTVDLAGLIRSNAG